MTARQARLILFAGGAAAFGLLMFASGWIVARGAVASGGPVAAVPAQVPLQEMVPLPRPGQEPVPGQGEECEPVILFYHQGRLYRLMPGPQDGQGQPGSPPEYFPLQPYQGPPIPGLPFQLPPGAPPRVPQGPGFQPVQPRF